MSAATIGRVVELMKSVRTAPLTLDEITTGFGWTKRAVVADIDELEKQGVLLRVEVHRGRPTTGFKLSSDWGGK